MKLSQTTRLVVLLLYAVLLFGVCRFLFGSWLPPTAEKGLWLYASFAHLLLGSLLLSPHFTKPVDAVSDAVVALLVLPEISGVVLSLNDVWASFAWKLLFAYYLIVIFAGTATMMLRGPRSRMARQITESLYIVCTKLGDAPLAFSLLFI